MDLVGYAIQRLTEFLSHRVIEAGDNSITIGTVLYLVSAFALLWIAAKRFERFLFKKLSSVEAFGEALCRRLSMAGRWSLFLVGGTFVLDASALDVTAVQIISYVDRFLNIAFIHVGKTQITPWTVLYVLSLWLLLVVVTNRLQRWFANKLLSRSGIDAGARHAAAVIVKYLFVSLGFIVILQSAGVDLSALTVLAGALGLGLSFGLQNITSNLVSGLIVLIERPIKIGDRIEVAGVTGDVKEIALRATTICTNDNIEIIVPNSEFISGNVINWSLSSRSVRVAVPVGVSYSSDPETVREILLKVADGQSGVLSEPEPTVVFKGFGESSLDFVLRVFTREFITTPQILQSELNFKIFKEFKKRGVAIPFPQRDIHIRSTVTGESSALSKEVEKIPDANEVRVKKKTRGNG